jgi:hypothetical protein
LVWDAPKVELFEGHLAPQDPVELSGELPLNLPSWLTGTFGLSAPELVLFVENEQGIACSMDVSGQIHSTNTPLPTPFVWTPSSPAVLPAAPAPHHVASAAVALDNASTSPPLGEWMHPGLSGFSYTARFTVLDAGSDLQFMTSEGRITMQPVIKVPFIGYAAQIAFRDTVPCDLQAALAEQLPDPLNWQNAERIALRFQTANLFPFAVAVQAQFLDAAGDPVDSLFMSSTTILEGAATEWQGSYYVPVAPGRSNWDLVFEGPSVEQLMQSGVQSLAFELMGCTSGSLEERPVAFVPGMGLEIQVGLRADLNLSTP